MRTRSAGFSLVELAVVMAIVALILGGAMFTLTAQVETRNFNETQQRLEQAKELVLAFAAVNKRLPCPAAAPPAPPFNNATGTGSESPAGGACTDFYTGFLPGRTIGFYPVDTLGYALDAWGNRIRYAVTSSTNGGVRVTDAHNPATAPWTIGWKPGDLIICASAVGGSTADCTPNSKVTDAGVVAAVIWSQGKNFSPEAVGGASGTDEAWNNKHRLPAVYSNHAAFVFHPPSSATGNEFDDQMVWIPMGLVYSRMIAAGVLP